MTTTGDESPSEPGARAGWRALGRGLGIEVRAGEGPPAALLFLSFFLLASFQYAAKSIRQATFVDALGADRLPWVYLLAALLSYPLLRVYGRLTDRFPHRRLLAATWALVAVVMVAFWWLFAGGQPWVAIAFYLFLSIAFVLMVSQFWVEAGQALDPRQAKRLFGLIGAGGLLGGVAGGQAARLASAFTGTRHALLAAAAMVAAAALVQLALSRASPPAAAPAAGGGRIESSRDGLDLVRRSRHLRLIAVLMLLGVTVGQIIDLQFSWAVEQATTELDQRTRYFGNLYSAIGLAAFVFQILFTSRIQRALGMGATMRVLPATMFTGSAALLVAGVALPAAVPPVALALKVGENGLRHSLEQATRELLFLPVPARIRMKAKAFIDVFVQRFAKGVAAVLLLPVTFGLLSPIEVGWGVLALTLVWLATTLPVQREYLRSFRAGLAQRRVEATLPIRISDSTTLELLVQSLGSPDPRQVLNSLEVLAAHGRGNLVMPLLLHHDDGLVRRRTLEILADSGRRDAAPLVERRLSDPEPENRALAIRVLAKLSGREAVELMKPRLRDTDPGVRAAAVAFLLSHAGGPVRRAAARVFAELHGDADPAVRIEAARALGGIPEPEFRAELMRLLYDPDPGVAREAIRAVRFRTATGVPVYLPTLVSILRNRRLKHHAREALVACGEAALPALLHFMTDPAEHIWVRRALPKAIAAIGTSQVPGALLRSLVATEDAFLRRKLIEALRSSPPAWSEPQLALMTEQARLEIRAYLTALRDLAALGVGKRARLEGPRIRWADEDSDPSLLEQLLIEILADHLRNVFGLLALRGSAEQLWAAYRSLQSGRKPARSHALEYLDNALDPSWRKDVFLAIDDLGLEEKLELARSSYGIERRSAVAVLAHLLAPAELANERTHDLAAAAVYTVYCDRIQELYPLVDRLAEEAESPFVRETAAWAAARIAPPSGAGRGDRRRRRASADV